MFSKTAAPRSSLCPRQTCARTSASVESCVILTTLFATAFEKTPPLPVRLLKFSQNPAMTQHRQSTGTTRVAEASPFTSVWGIDLRADDPEANDPRRWRGKKMLRIASSGVRDDIAAGLAHPASSHQFCTPTSSDRIHEIYPAPSHPSAPARACSRSPSEYSTCFLTRHLATAPRFRLSRLMTPPSRCQNTAPASSGVPFCSTLPLSPKSALTGHYFVDILPQPDLLSVEEHVVSSGLPVLHSVGVVDLERGDLLAVAHAPLLRVPLDALQHNSRVTGPSSGLPSALQVSAVADSPFTAVAKTSPSPALLERLTLDQTIRSISLLRTKIPFLPRRFALPRASMSNA